MRDTILITELQNDLTIVRTYLDNNDPLSAKAALQNFMDRIGEASDSQRTTEAKGLLFYNAKYLTDRIKLPPQRVPHLTLTPEGLSRSIGEIHTAYSNFWVEVDGSWDFPYVPIKLKVTSGPNEGLVLESLPSGSFGPATFRYTSAKEGIDLLETSVEGMAEFPQGVKSPSAWVKWKGGPDLRIEHFIPPFIKAKGGDRIPIRERTGNAGNGMALDSITRYFLSADSDINPAIDRPIGERFLPPLSHGESSEVSDIELQLPVDLPEGFHHLGACADADGSVAELNEDNNCIANQIVFSLIRNQPPDCTNASPSERYLWPPNHRLVPISIIGVNDPDGDEVTLSITGITQDEPVNGLGDGDTSPDGFGVGTAQAEIRVERSGRGNGRVYYISFTADDKKGGTCSGQVIVGVPHDQGKGRIPMNDGQIYDSTKHAS